MPPNPPGPVLLPKSHGSRPRRGLAPVAVAAVIEDGEGIRLGERGWALRSLFTDFLTRSKAAVLIVKVNLAVLADRTNGRTRPRSCSVLIHRTKFSTDTTLPGLSDADRAGAPFTRLVADDCLALRFGDFLRLEATARRDDLGAMGFLLFQGWTCSLNSLLFC